MASKVVLGYKPTECPVSAKKATRVHLKVRSDCELAISIYPSFKYNATGGQGWGTVTHMEDGKLFLKFDVSTLTIPDFNYKTATLGMFGFPVPPPINIEIKPIRLEGTLDPETGIVGLHYDSDFFFTATPLYAPPPLCVKTFLSTETVQGKRLGGKGTRLINNYARLVGVGEVAPIKDALMDAILLLPNDAYAVMSAEFEFFE